MLSPGMKSRDGRAPAASEIDVYMWLIASIVEVRELIAYNSLPYCDERGSEDGSSLEQCDEIVNCVRRILTSDRLDPLRVLPYRPCTA